MTATHHSCIHTHTQIVILQVHAATYQSVGKSHVSEAVGLTGAELETFLLKGSGGLVAGIEDGGEKVVFAPTKENQPRVRKYKEKTDLTNMVGMLTRLH